MTRGVPVIVDEQLAVADKIDRELTEAFAAIRRGRPTAVAGDRDMALVRSDHGGPARRSPDPDRGLRPLDMVPPTLDLGTTDLVRCVRINALQFHSAGADAADELALALSTTVAYLRVLFDGGMDRERAARQLWFQIAVGRDVFGELCKLRALRLLAGKVYAAAGLASAPPPIHAVSSPRTQAQRDPWVNMLRVTTEVFAGILGGAELVSPVPFDDALAVPSELGIRVARNTALVVRDESQLGRVIDAAGGSYYIESRTDALAREAWRRFQQIERDGGVIKLAASGALHERLANAWHTRAASIGNPKQPILGVSEYANLGEKLPSAIPAPTSTSSEAPPTHRDAEGFEALRDRTATRTYDVMLVQLGTPAESRARASRSNCSRPSACARARSRSPTRSRASRTSRACAVATTTTPRMQSRSRPSSANRAR